LLCPGDAKRWRRRRSQVEFLAAEGEEMGELKARSGAGFSMGDETTSVRVAVRVRPQVKFSFELCCCCCGCAARHPFFSSHMRCNIIFSQ